MLCVKDAVSGAALSCLGAAVLIHAQSFPNMPGQRIGAWLFPTVVGALLIACGLALVVSGHRRRSTMPALALPASLRTPATSMALLALVLGVAFVALAAPSLGFLIVLPLALIAWFKAAGVRWLPAIVGAVAMAAVLQVVFYSLLRVPLPWGVLAPIAW